MKTFTQWIESADGENEVKKADLERWVNMDSVGVIQASVEKLNKIAAKLGMSPITVQFKGKRKPEGMNQQQYDAYVNQHGVEPVEILVKVEGEAPRVGHHDFIATIESHIDPKTGQTVNQIKAVPGQQVPEKYRTGFQGQCDHCCTARDRKETFIVRDQRDGSFKVVGRNCLADFLRSDDLGTHIQWVQLMGALESGMEEGGWSGGGFKQEVITPIEFLKVAKAVIDKRGTYVKSQRPDDESPRESTKDTVLSIIRRNPFAGPRGDHRQFQRIEQLKAEFAHAKDIPDEEINKILDWLREQAQKPNPDGYWHNAFVISIKPMLGPGDFGTAASIPWSYKKATERIEAKKRPEFEAAAQPTWNKGDKITFKGTVIAQGSFDGQFGTTYIYTIKDDQNHLLKWFTGRDEMEKGKQYKITNAIVSDIGPDRYFKDQIVTKIKGNTGTRIADLSEPQMPEGEANNPLPHEKGYKVIKRGEPTLAKVKKDLVPQLEAKVKDAMDSMSWDERRTLLRGPETMVWHVIPLILAIEWEKFASASPEAAQSFEARYGYPVANWVRDMKDYFKTRDDLKQALTILGVAPPVQEESALAKLISRNWSAA